jgi:predicted dehydrogenase
MKKQAYWEVLMEKIRLGLIGCGGRAKAHMKTWVKSEDVTVVAVADPIEERRVAAAQMFGCEGVYANHT